jgi:hypothetical protein
MKLSLIVEVGLLNSTNDIAVKYTNLGHSLQFILDTLLSRGVIHA